MSVPFRRSALAAAVTAALGVTAFAASSTAASAATTTLKSDSYSVAAGRTLTVAAKQGVFANDNNALTALFGGAKYTTVVNHTDPSHGSLTLNEDGSFSYTPDAGFTGKDTFTYSSADSVDLYKTALDPFATVGGVKITGGAFGSSFTASPTSSSTYFGLTDRGPNVTAPSNFGSTSKVEPVVDFTPQIGEFTLANGKATLVKRILLKAPDGTPYNGQVNCNATTGETIYDIDGNKLPCSDTGYDSEGLAVLKDGTFWVSDEYGPFMTHFSADGTQIGRLTPFDHSLPRELANRIPNKGMEGLTITPDGSTLVGIMQSALQQPDLGKTSASKVAPVRIVTVNLKTFATHEYLYMLHDPAVHSGAVSEISALSNTTFVVDERDGNFEPNAFKQLYKVDISKATDVGPSSTVAGATYSANGGGLLLGGKSIEATVGTSDTATATATLAAAGITPVSSTLDVDLGAFITTLNPTGDFYGHDKVEGIAVRNGGKTLIVSNDNDFGIDGIIGDDGKVGDPVAAVSASQPFQLHTKTLPNGTQDDGEYLAIDTTKLGDPVLTGTVTITVK